MSSCFAKQRQSHDEWSKKILESSAHLSGAPTCNCGEVGSWCCTRNTPGMHLESGGGCPAAAAAELFAGNDATHCTTHHTHTVPHTANDARVCHTLYHTLWYTLYHTLCHTANDATLPHTVPHNVPDTLPTLPHILTQCQWCHTTRGTSLWNFAPGVLHQVRPGERPLS